MFTLGSYAIAPLGLAGGLWALKALAVGASVGAIALVATTARKMGRSARAAAVFVGLNPVLLVLAAGGAHNDTLVLLVLAGALALAAGRTASHAADERKRADRMGRDGSYPLRSAAAAMAVGVGVKASAGLVLPFMMLAPPRWRERARVAGGAVAALAALAL